MKDAEELKRLEAKLTEVRKEWTIASSNTRKLRESVDELSHKIILFKTNNFKPESYIGKYYDLGDNETCFIKSWNAKRKVFNTVYLCYYKDDEDDCDLGKVRLETIVEATEITKEEFDKVYNQFKTNIDG